MIIAEIGQAHEGSLGILHSYIDAVAETGVDAIKFQTHIAVAESSIHEPFRVNFSYEDKTRFDYWQRMEFSFEQWVGIKRHCDELGLEFISSPFSNAAVDLLEKLEVNSYKIGSGEVTNLLMLERIANTGKKVLLSSGMSDFKELDEAVALLKVKGCEYNVFQCTTSYPTASDQWGLNVIQELRDRYQVDIGFSDHSGDIYACLAATSLGASLLEFHAVFDKRIFGPDNKSSIEIDQIKDLVKGVHEIRKALKNPIVKSDLAPYANLKGIFQKSLAINRPIMAGELIQFSDLEGKKPSGMGIPASKFRDIIGKKLKRSLEAWEFLNFSDFE